MKYSIWILAAVIFTFSMRANAGDPSSDTKLTPYESPNFCSDDRFQPDIRIAFCEKMAQRHIWLHKGQIDLLDGIAAAYEDKSDYDNAIKILSKAVSLAEHSEIAYQQIMRGYAYLDQGRTDLAAADFKVAMAENYSGGYAGMAEVSAAEGRYDEAVALYDKAIALAPGDMTVLAGRATIYALMGDYKKARADSDLFVKDDPRNANAYNNRCWNLAILNQYFDTAAADCKHAVELSPDDPRLLDSLGFVLFRQQKWEDSIAAYNDGLKHNPVFAPSLYMRGMAEMRKGDNVKGQADIDLARRINPRVSATYANYGIVP